MLVLLRRNAAFRYLWLSRLVSFVGDALALVALILYVAAHRSDGFAVAALLLAGDLGPTLLSPWTATFADRVDMRALMVWCEVLQAIAMVAIVFALSSLPLLFVLVAARGVIAHVFLPASRSAVARIVDDPDLESANALLGLGTFGLEAVGAAMAAALIPLVGTRGALLIDAATFLGSAALLLALPALPSARCDLAPEARTTLHRDALDGIRALLEEPVVRTVSVGFTAFVAFTAMDDVALAFLGRDELKAGTSATALLYAGSGVGLLIGFVLLGRRRRAAPSMVFVAGMALAGAGNLLTGLAWATYAAFTMQTLRGIGTSAVDVGSSTLLQRTVPAERLGRTFGNLYGLVGFAAGVSYLAGGAMLAVVSPRVVFAVAGGGALAAAALTAARLARFGSGIGDATENDSPER